MQPIPSALLVAVVAIGACSWALAARRRARLAADRRLALLLHQLKNPIQSILLHTDLLRDATAAASSESRAELCAAILTEAQRLSTLIADFSATAPARDVVPGSAGPARRPGKPV
jgi:signal transduction histidine kinase